jgi:hypothetical protein
VEGVTPWEREAVRLHQLGRLWSDLATVAVLGWLAYVMPGPVSQNALAAGQEVTR